MPTASSPTAPAGYADIIARTISARFSTRPTLRSVTASLLKDELLEKYPPLDFDPYRTQVAQPLPEGGWRLTLLLEVALNYLASGKPPALSEQFGRACFLTNKPPTHLSLDSTGQHEPDMQLIADIIRELPAIVFVAFQEALSEYWNTPAEAGNSRWQWLGDLLGGVLKTSAVRQASINPQHAEILTELCQHPDKQQRLEAPWAKGLIQACTLETTLNIGELSVNLQSPDILLICGETVLLCSVTGSIESFASLEAFGQAWGERFELLFMADAISWKRYEPDGNIFDTQAALLLNQQLEDLAALKLPAGQHLEELEQRFKSITDVAALFVGAQAAGLNTHVQRIRTTMPEWLQTADAIDRMAYRKHVLTLASIKQRTGGRTFQTGLDDLHTFAKKALHRQMLEDQPQAPGYDADQLELTFHVPVGDMGSGYLEPVNMTLTELAIKNLAGRPKGRMTIRHTGGQLIQDWTTEAYLLDLVSRVDVGQHYPELIRRELLADTAPAQERGRLFGLELSVRLPLLALEQSIKAEHGFTRQGYRYVDAVLQRTQAERCVDQQEIVLRPLAFQRKAGADGDVASNLFIIEPLDLNAAGPRILYRPQYTPALQQFADRAALFNAIAQPGALQASVLTWLPDRARPMYANNGFNEPHIVHMHLGDEFSPPTKPAPATLSGDEASGEWLAALKQGRLLRQLFDSNARALVELADRQSISNAESRWAIILEGGWLVFNNLVLPMLRGPAMLVGWMLQLTHSLIQDLPALDSDDVTAREQAWVDVLLNLGLVLLHVGQNRLDSQLALSAPNEPPLTLAPLRRALSQAHVPGEIPVTEAAPGFPSEPPGSGHTLLDFNLSTARDSASARLFEHLRAVRVAWPATLPEPVAIGPFKGLYRINDTWHATVAGLLFRVQIVPGFGEVFLVHPEHPDHPGIKLKTDGRGRWSLDQGLKLVGGGRKSRIAAEKEKRRERIEELKLQSIEFFAQQEQVQKRVDIADNLRIIKESSAASSSAERTAFRQRYVAELDKQTQSYRALIAGTREKSALTDLPLDLTLISGLLENIIRNARKRVVIADMERDTANTDYSDYRSGPDKIHELLKAEGDVVVTRYFKFMEKNREINETMISSFEEIERRVEELRQIPLLGAKTLEALNKDRPENELTGLRVKVYHLVILRILSVKVIASDVSPAMESVINPLQILARSHAELQTTHVYERGDRIAVLDNLVERYKNAQSALGGISIFNADELQMPAFNRLRVLIDELRVDAEQRLVEEIERLASEQEPPADEASSQAPGTSKEASKKKPKVPVTPTGKKRVIKTPKGALIGDLRPRVPDQGADIIDIKGPMDDKPLVSFHEHEPNVWVEIVDTQPSASRPASTPLPQLKGDARKALAKVDDQVRKIEGYAQGGSSPREIEEQLQREAQKLSHYADSLDKHEDASPAREKDAALIAELRNKARSLEGQATQSRIRLTLAQAPTSDGVQFLLQHQELHVRPIGRRVQLKTGRKNFMQEYALFNRNDQALWYAHFHYAELTDDKATFTTAHLKTEAQRFETYESAMAKATNPAQKIQIYHGAINPTLANQYFLPLEPR
ncbi:hypothetical protein QF019_004382 [Pseudomonas frederiksbergensis]|uniref:dermonecrotic toxin domain-containing protein n=1 Tax=Pseudomonas frederiksbergensis TaxID=104087 RepID=UPI003D1D8578